MAQQIKVLTDMPDDPSLNSGTQMVEGGNFRKLSLDLHTCGMCMPTHMYKQINKLINVIRIKKNSNCLETTGVRGAFWMDGHYRPWLIVCQA